MERGRLQARGSRLARLRSRSYKGKIGVNKASRVVIVSCPACATRFSLDASLLGPNGRNVRCAKCGHRWKQEAPAMATEMPGFGPPESAAPEDPPPSAPAPAEMAPGLASLLGVHERQAAAKPSAIPSGLTGPDTSAS